MYTLNLLFRITMLWLLIIGIGEFGDLCEYICTLTAWMEKLTVGNLLNNFVWQNYLRRPGWFGIP